MRRMLLPLMFATALGLAPTRAAISVGMTGSELWTFQTAPAATEWATGFVLPGASADFTTAAALDAAVQALSASDFTNSLVVTATTNPAPSVNGRATYNSLGQYVLLRPGGVAASALLATLRNDTGTDQPSLTVSYTFRAVNPPLVMIAEEVPGLRVYFSRSGVPGSWQLIPELSDGVLGPLWARLPLLEWAAGAPLYLLWADDNALANADNLAADEGAYAIDDFSASTVVVDPFAGVRLLSPSSGQRFLEGDPIELVAFPTLGLGVVTNVLFYDGTNLLGRVAAPPLPATLSYTNAAPGLHALTAVGINSGIALTSTVVTVTVTARPRLAITVPGFPLAEISWPDSFTGFQLQSTTDLRAGVWEPVLEPDNPSDGLHRVTIDTLSGSRFFRLEKP